MASTFAERRRIAEPELRACVRCGLALAEASEPQRKDGRDYCCSACAQGSACVCD